MMPVLCRQLVLGLKDLPVGWQQVGSLPASSLHTRADSPGQRETWAQPKPDPALSILGPGWPDPTLFPGTECSQSSLTVLGSGARGVPGWPGLCMGWGGSTKGLTLVLPSKSFPAAVSELEIHVKERKTECPREKLCKCCRISPGRRRIPARGCSSLSLPAWAR